jgi:hypothetical protein
MFRSGFILPAPPTGTSLPLRVAITSRTPGMTSLRMAGIALIVAGALGLTYGSFSYTRDTHEAKLGPLELSIKDKETVNVPIWAGAGAIILGVVLLVVRPRG